MNQEKLLKHLRELSEEKFVSLIIKIYLKEAIKEIERLRSICVAEAEKSEQRKFLLLEWISVEPDDWSGHTSAMADLGYRTRELLESVS